MSDAPEGQGWWQASDGKWYAPELHPDAQAAAAPAAPLGPTTAPPPDLPPVPMGPQPTWEPPPAPATWEAPAPAPAPPAPSSRAWIPRAIIVADLAIMIILLALLLLRD